MAVPRQPDHDQLAADVQTLREATREAHEACKSLRTLLNEYERVERSAGERAITAFGLAMRRFEDVSRSRLDDVVAVMSGAERRMDDCVQAMLKAETPEDVSKWMANELAEVIGRYLREFLPLDLSEAAKMTVARAWAAAPATDPPGVKLQMLHSPDMRKLLGPKKS